MKPVFEKLNEINKYVLNNYKQHGDNTHEVLIQIQELIWEVWDVITLELHKIEREKNHETTLRHNV